MIQGETVLPKLLPRKGPSGCDSHCWTSRADQSLNRPSPTRWSPASPIGIGWPSSFPGPDPHRQFELLIELSARAEARRILIRRFALAARTSDRHTRRPHRRGPAVISDGYIFVVRAERVVRIAPHTAISRVVDAGEEIGVAADRRWQVHRAIGDVVQQLRRERLDLRLSGVGSR